jgi:hypothetical protein
MDDVGLVFLKESTEYFETFKGFTLVFHGLDITGFGTIVDEGNEELIALPQVDLVQSNVGVDELAWCGGAMSLT